MDVTRRNATSTESFFIGLPKQSILDGGGWLSQRAPRIGRAKLHFDAFAAEQKQPPDTGRKQQEEKRNGQQLLEGFHLADKMVGNKKGLEWTKGNHGKTEDKSDRSPDQSSDTRPATQLKQADSCPNAQRDQAGGDNSDQKESDRMRLIQVLSPNIGRSIQDRKKKMTPNEKGGGTP